jgi:hypothetical protein
MNLALISLRKPGMKGVVFRIIEVLLSVSILAAAVHLLLILYFAGYSLPLSFAMIKAQGVTASAILLVALIILRLVTRCRTAAKDLSTYMPAILFGVFLILSLANGVTKWTGDTLPARYLPLSLLREGDFDLNEFPFLYAQGIPYYLRHLNNRYVSNSPVGPAIAALPFHLMPALGAVHSTDRLIEELEKLAAASMVALSACLLYLVLRRLAIQRLALFLTLMYALGTSSFSVSSQALWQHGPSQLALTTGLYSLVRGCEVPVWIGLAGFSLAFAVLCRPTDLLLLLPLGACVILYPVISVDRAHKPLPSGGSDRHQLEISLLRCAVPDPDGRATTWQLHVISVLYCTGNYELLTKATAQFALDP